MYQKVIVVTEQDMEYGYDIFCDVFSTPEKALEYYRKLGGYPIPSTNPEILIDLALTEEKDQICIIQNSKLYSTIYFLKEVEVK